MRTAEEGRVAILVSHPIQYYAPLFQALAKAGVDLEVWYCSDHGVNPSWDESFEKSIRFDIPLTDGYRHLYLRRLLARQNAPDLVSIRKSSTCLANEIEMS